MAYVSPGNVPASDIEAIDPTVTRVVSADPRLIIPKLNVDVPVHFGIKISEVMEAMKNGVALENVYVCGGLLGGRDVLLMGSGGGVALMTALHVSELVSRYHFS